MSQENAETVRQSFAAVRRQAWEEALAAYSTDVEWDDRDLRPEGAVHRGLDAMNAEMGAWLRAWSNYVLRLERVVAIGDEVVVVLREGGEGRTSGLRLDQVIGMVFGFEDGKIVQVRLFRDPSAALEAVGLGE